MVKNRNEKQPERRRPPNVTEMMASNDFRLVREAEEFTPYSKPQPTDALPGSEEKIDVLRARIENGEELFHEDDRLKYSDED